MDVDLNLALGLFGSFSQLAAFALNLNGKLEHDSAIYVGINAFGSIFTSYYAIVSGNMPFLLLEATWGVFAFWKLFGILGKKKRK